MPLPPGSSLPDEGDADPRSAELPTLDEMRTQVRAYYLRSNLGDLERLFDPLDEISIYLQYWYIVENSNEVGQKDLLDKAADGSRYSDVHVQANPPIRNFQARYGFDDVVLADVDSGRIVYSTAKEVDFGTSLKDGPYAMTSIGHVFQQAARATWKGYYAFVDYSPYLPSREAPASFIAAPIFDNDKKIGVAILQMSIQWIDSIMTENAGLGMTGEAYLVGRDRLFRSNSRFLAELGVATTIINPEIVVDTQATRGELQGQAADTRVINDYRGKRVLSSWMPIRVYEPMYQGEMPVTWTLIAEIDLSEVRGPVRAVATFAVVVCALSALLVLWISYLISARFTRESRRQAGLVSGIGDSTGSLASASEELSSVSQLLSANAEETTAQANVVSSSAEQVSASAQSLATGVDNLSASVREIAESRQRGGTRGQPLRPNGLGGERSN